MVLMLMQRHHYSRCSRFSRESRSVAPCAVRYTSEPLPSYRKYRFMEANSLQRRQGLEDKVPELERTIAMVETLQRKKVSCSFRCGDAALSTITHHLAR